MTIMMIYQCYVASHCVNVNFKAKEIIANLKV